MYTKSINLLITSFFIIFSSLMAFDIKARDATLSTDYYCKEIGLAEGLSQSSVTSILYDTHGSLWVGTRYGLNEYRNRVIRNITEGGDEGMIGNYITMLFLDKDDQLWISTDSGISKYDRENDRFEHVIPQVAYTAYQDNKCIYFGTDEGIISYSNSSFSISPLANAYIIDIYPLNDKLLLIDKGLGLWIFDGHSYTRVNTPMLENAIILSSAISGNTLFLSIYRKGFCAIDIDDLSKPPLFFYNTTNSDLSFDVILDMQLSNGKLWLGTDGGGVNVFDLENHTFDIVDVPAFSITSIYEDPYLNMWLGSVRSGLYGLRSSKYITLNSQGDNLSNDVIISLCTGSNNKVWIGTDGGGVNIYDSKTGKINQIESTYGMKVSSLAELPDGRILLSDYSKGLNILDSQSGTWEPFILVDKVTNDRECFYGNSPIIYRIDETRYIISAIDVYEYDFSTGIFNRFVCEFGSSTLDMHLCGTDGNIYYAYSPSGVFSIDCRTYTISRIRAQIDDSSISSAVFDGSHLWIGTSNGLYCHNCHTGKTEPVMTNLFKRITWLQLEGNKVLWIAADNILFRKDGERFEIVGENEGIAPNEVLAGLSINHNEEKAILLGGTRGLIKIKTDGRITQSYFTKDIELYNVSVGGKRTSINNNKIHLPSKFPSIKICVTLPISDPFCRNVYRYSILGKTSYSIETYDDFLILPDLKEGEYIMEASYLKNDGMWSKPTEVLQIIVMPPWFRSIWFTCVWILTLLIFLYIISTRIYHNKMLKIEQRIRAENSDFIKKLNRYIIDNLDNPQMDIPAIADHMAMSRASLYSKVKKVIGKSVGQYIDDLRIKEACYLLKEENISIADIADKVGYSSSRYFSTRFKQQTGMTPREFRAANSTE